MTGGSSASTVLLLGRARYVQYTGAWPQRHALLPPALRDVDALHFHLCGVAREDGEHSMDPFRIVKREDEVTNGEYRTKRVVLGEYDK